MNFEKIEVTEFWERYLALNLPDDNKDAATIKAVIKPFLERFDELLQDQSKWYNFLNIFKYIAPIYREFRADLIYLTHLQVRRDNDSGKWYYMIAKEAKEAEVATVPQELKETNQRIDLKPLKPTKAAPQVEQSGFASTSKSTKVNDGGCVGCDKQTDEVRKVAEKLAKQHQAKEPELIDLSGTQITDVIADRKMEAERISQPIPEPFEDLDLEEVEVVTLDHLRSVRSMAQCEALAGGKKDYDALLAVLTDLDATPHHALNKTFDSLAKWLLRWAEKERKI